MLSRGNVYNYLLVREVDPEFIKLCAAFSCPNLLETSHALMLGSESCLTGDLAGLAQSLHSKQVP